MIVGAGGGGLGRSATAPGRESRGLRGPGSVVSGSEEDSVAVRASVPRHPGGTPSRVSAAAVAHHGRDQRSWLSGGAFSLACSSTQTTWGGGGVLRLRGSLPAWRSTLGRWRQPHPPFCVRHQGSGVRSTGRWAIAGGRVPASRHQPPRPLVPSPVGPAVIRASASLGAGAAAVGVCWAVAPVDEGSAQAPGQPDSGLRVSYKEYRYTLQETWPPRLLVGPFRHKHGPEDPFLLYPEVAQFSHPYTYSTTGRVSTPRGSETASQSRTHLSRTSARRGSPTAPHCRFCPWLLRHWGGSHLQRLRAGTPCRPGAGLLRWLGPRLPRRGGGVVRGAPVWGGLAARKLGEPGGDQGPQRGVDVVDGQGVVVVGVVRRHLLDARGDAAHRLELWLQGLPAPLHLRLVPFALPTPTCPRAPSSLSLVACVAPSLLALWSPRCS